MILFRTICVSRSDTTGGIEIILIIQPVISYCHLYRVFLILERAEITYKIGIGDFCTTGEYNK